MEGQDVLLNGESVFVLGANPSLHDDQATTDDDVESLSETLSEAMSVRREFPEPEPVIADFDGFCKVITDIYEKVKPDKTGEIWNLLEEQSMRCNGSGENWCVTTTNFYRHFGAAVCTVDGQRFAVGDSEVDFSAQDLSKVLGYLMTVSRLGEDVVHTYQGKEPSGRRRNEIVLDQNGKPHNPLINAGGIMSAALILKLVRPEVTNAAMKYEEVFQFVNQLLDGNGGLGFNNSLFLRQTRESMDSEFELAYLMRRNGCFPPGVQPQDINKILEFYFQLRCLEMNCESLSVLGAILAAATSSSSSGGLEHPKALSPASFLSSTGHCGAGGGSRLLTPTAVRNTLALMYSCGMADYSGQFAFQCGLPAISSVSGCMLVVIPGVAGVALYSPPLDRFHNPHRAVRFCQELVETYTLHRFSGIGVCRKHLRLPTKPKSLYSDWTCEHDRKMQIMLAAAYGDLRYLKTAFFRGVDLSGRSGIGGGQRVAIVDSNGRTPLHLAAAEGHAECVEFLTAICGADAGAKDRRGNTPRSEARRAGYEELAEMMEAQQHVRI